MSKQHGRSAVVSTAYRSARTCSRALRRSTGRYDSSRSWNGRPTSRGSSRDWRAFVSAVTLTTLSTGSCNRRVFEEVKASCDRTLAEDIEVPTDKAADILIVVDNSGSMASEQDKVAARFHEFFAQLLVSGVDFHIGVVTSDPTEEGALLARDPDDVGALILLGRARIALGDYEGALTPALGRAVQHRLPAG
mgnify:CR=1 FL=1